MEDEKVEQPKKSLKRYLKYLVPAVGVALAGLYHQGYISEAAYKAILNLILNTFGLAI